MMVELYRRAEAQLRDQRKGRRSKARGEEYDTGPERLLHELEVHQIELELQNAELQKARDEMEVALEKYTDLYDFAPVGYFSLDEAGVILEANLTGAALLGIERSRLMNRRLPLFMSPAYRKNFLAFLGKMFSGSVAQSCEVLVLKEGGAAFWAGFRATPAVSLAGTRKWCRVAVSDIDEQKRAEDTRRRMEILTVSNHRLEAEVVRRQAVEKALKQSEQHQTRLLEQSRYMQEQLRHLSRKVLRAQEDERQRISRELHDVVAQTLAGINVQLATLNQAAAFTPRDLGRKIERTQRLVEHSMNIVHQFARELRPVTLDDLGLIPALHTFLKGFKQKTGIHVTLSAPASVNELNSDKRTVLFRVAQEALANIARHAQACKADVIIQKLDGAVCMSVKDNGRGFQEERVLRARKHRHLGLLGMRERVEMVGGTFAIQSAPRGGTVVLAEVPLTDGHARRGDQSAKAGGTNHRKRWHEK